MINKKILFSSLRSRLLFLVCLVTFPVFLFAFYLADKERASVLVRIKQDALHIAKLASREHSHQIKGAQNLLLWVGDKLNKEGKNSLIFKDPSFLSTLLAGHPQLSNIGVLSPNGDVIASAYPLKSYQNWKNNPAFISALKSKEVSVGNYTISPIFERPTLNLIYAVRNKQGHIWTVLFNGLNLEWLSQIAQQANLPGGFSLLITDKKGKILAHDGEIQKKDYFINNLQSSDITNYLNGDQGKIIKVNGSTLKHYFLSIPLEGSPDLYIVIGLEYDKLLKEAAFTFYRTLGWISFLVIFTIFIVILAAEISILRVLRALAFSVQRFGNGDLSIRVQPITGDDEFSSLANSFNTMADSLALKYNELIEAKTQMSALATKIQTLREEEAKRISRELHDEIGQLLTSLKIDLSLLKSVCSPENTEQDCSKSLNNAIEKLSDKINSSITIVRRIASELRPSVLDNLGFFSAIQWQARQIESKTQLIINVDLEGNESLVNEKVSITLFRIVQEALTNIVRHANASMVEIKVSMNSDFIFLTIKDNGKGATKESIEAPDSLGLIGMQERITAVNGEILIKGESDAGTEINAIVPLSNTQKTQQ